MSSTLTIRLSAAQREALKKRATALRKTESGLIRELVEREIAEVSLASIVEKFAGTVSSEESGVPPHPFQQQIQERNWRK